MHYLMIACVGMRLCIRVDVTVPKLQCFVLSLTQKYCLFTHVEAYVHMYVTVQFIDLSSWASHSAQ